MFGRRRLQKRVGLALGSGAARGWAHLGVIRAVEEAGHEVAWLSGCSMGAFVAVAHALGRTDQLEAFARGLTPRRVWTYVDMAVPVRGLLDGEKVAELFRDVLGPGDLEDAPVPVGVVATDLADGREVRIRKGPAADAVRASIAIPGIFAPVVRDGRHLADGGLVNPVPVDLARELGADNVIAVDLNDDIVEGKWVRPDAPEAEPDPQAIDAVREVARTVQTEVEPRESLSLIERRYRALEAQLKEKAAAWIAHAARPNIFDILGASINIVAREITRQRLEAMRPALVIRPKVGDMSLWDFAEADAAIEAGYRSAREALAAD